MELESGAPPVRHGRGAVLVHQQPSGRDDARVDLEGRTRSVVAGARARRPEICFSRVLIAE